MDDIDKVDRERVEYFCDSPWFTVHHGHGATHLPFGASRAFLGPNGRGDIGGWCMVWVGRYDWGVWSGVGGSRSISIPYLARVNHARVGATSVGSERSALPELAGQAATPAAHDVDDRHCLK